eukprot:6351414-Pyramimonas_sp.AAC.2
MIGPSMPLKSVATRMYLGARSFLTIPATLWYRVKPTVQIGAKMAAERERERDRADWALSGDVMMVMMVEKTRGVDIECCNGDCTQGVSCSFYTVV